MGRQAYPIIGGLIGAGVAFFATGGTATFQGYAAGFALGSALGGVAGSYIDPILIQGNKIGDNQIQVAAEGGARAIMYGRACVTATCIIARGNRKIVKTKTSNGKGSSGKTQNETVTWTFAIGLSESIVGSSISRIWQDENLVYDVLGDGSVSDDDNVKFSRKFRFYDGNETQLPDADLQVFLGADTPYFRGTAYVVFPNFDLTNTAERVPTFRFEVISGVAGVIDALESLEWNYPTTGEPGGTLTPQSQSVTLTGSPDAIWNANLYLTGAMELRDYVNVIEVVGGDGHFVTATNDEADTIPLANVYRISIDNPAQVYYVNRLKPGENPLDEFHSDGSSTYKLAVQIAGNATIEFFADPEDGAGGFAPQFGHVRAEIVGVTPGSNETISLGSVVSSLMRRAGMNQSDFDVTALDDQIAGVCLQSTVSGADAINICVQPFFADPCEVDGVLTFVKRGGDVLRTLTVDDLTEESDVKSRENSIEYPAKLNFFYQSPATGYAVTKATAYRYSAQVDSSGEGSVTAPITFYGSDEPARIANKLQKVMWTEAEGSFTWMVGKHCIDLIPTDVVGLYLRGIATRARVLAIENNGSTLKLTLIKDRQSSYTSNVTGIPLPIPTPPDPATMSKAVLAVLDIPALQDTDDALIYYTAISGSTGIWQGAQLQRSMDDGVTWTAIGEVTRDVTMGKLTVAMTAADREYTDTTNTVTVQLFDAVNELVAFSDTTFLQEQGAIAVQLGDGTWEVMQYRDVLDGGSGLWTLSYLQRGRLNTVAGAHAVNALFMLLENDVVKNNAQTAWLGGVIKHRAVSYGESVEDADVVAITYRGESQIEWSPASASAAYDGTYVYIHDIVPRHRFGTEINPIASTNFEGFRVTLTDGTSVVTSDIPAGNAAHIIAAPLSSVTSIAVAGINKLTGEGEQLIITPASVGAGSLTPEAIINAGGGT